MDDYEVVAFGSPPASAGSTEVVSMSPASVWDHPRERGEHMARQYVDAERLAITPARAGRHGRTYLAITPASAGSTGPLCPRRTSTKDHPRERGEHTRWRAPRVGRDHLRERGEHECLQEWVNGGLGSPPRARGARDRRGGAGLLVRITPASAGSTVTELAL